MGEWRRLSGRVIWVDLAQSVLALLPTVVAVVVFRVELSSGTLWPLVGVSAWGVLGAVADVLRWLFTSYRVTGTEIERRTGVLVRAHRSVRRDRIRSVDTAARLRHRLAGLRVVTIGAGQQTAAGEAAFVLDALTTEDAARLRRELLGGRAPERAVVSARGGTVSGESSAEDPSAALEDEDTAEAEVLATLRPSWVLYNMFSIWAYLTAAGLLWGAFWLASTFGIDLLDLASRAADWESLGWAGITVVVLVGGGLIGATGMAVSFVASYWRFELARVRTDEGAFLRTRRGLFSTREVSRDEARLRGMSIAEPLFWRWMRMADTNVITTGLGVWDMDQPTAILPRGPRGVARRVAALVLRDPNPFDASLARHPAAALRRRLWWATAVTAAAVALVIGPVMSGAVPRWVLWAAIGLWPLALTAAIAAYRALGHTIDGDYLVVRSGLLTRTTSVLRRDAVSTIAVRQSVLQRRLGLSTVSAMTAAGWGIYEAPDVAAPTAVALAAQAAPGLLDEFVEHPPAA